MRIEVTVPPTVEPVSLDEAKQYLRVTHDLEDSVILRSLSAARAACERTARIAICPQTIRMTVRAPWRSTDSLGISSSVRDPDDVRVRVRLPRPPVSQVSGVYFLDSQGAESEVSAFTFNQSTAALFWDDAASVFSTHVISVAVVFEAGWAVTDDVSSAPPEVKEAVLVTLADYYENRDSASSRIPPAAMASLADYFTGMRASG